MHYITCMAHRHTHTDTCIQTCVVYVYTHDMQPNPLQGSVPEPPEPPAMGLSWVADKAGSGYYVKPPKVTFVSNDGVAYAAGCGRSRARTRGGRQVQQQRQMGAASAKEAHLEVGFGRLSFGCAQPGCYVLAGHEIVPSHGGAPGRDLAPARGGALHRCSRAHVAQTVTGWWQLQLGWTQAGGGPPGVFFGLFFCAPVGRCDFGRDFSNRPQVP